MERGAESFPILSLDLDLDLDLDLHANFSSMPVLLCSLGMAVGSLAPTVESAVAISPAVMVIFIVFGGLYVVNTPSYLRWVSKVSIKGASLGSWNIDFCGF